MERRGRGTKKKKIKEGLLVLTAAAGLACIPGTALAFLTARGQGGKSGLDGRVHIIRGGEISNCRNLLEPGVEHRIWKDVKVKNEENVPCYVRARILESSSEAEWTYEMGDEENWEKRGDFYYYKKMVAPGESTSSLIRAVRVQRRKNRREISDSGL